MVTPLLPSLCACKPSVPFVSPSLLVSACVVVRPHVLHVRCLRKDYTLTWCFPLLWLTTPLSAKLPVTQSLSVALGRAERRTVFFVGAHCFPMECVIHSLMMRVRPPCGALPVPWRPASHVAHVSQQQLRVLRPQAARQAALLGPQTSGLTAVSLPSLVTNFPGLE